MSDRVGNSQTGVSRRVLSSRKRKLLQKSSVMTDKDINKVLVELSRSKSHRKDKD